LANPVLPLPVLANPELPLPRLANPALSLPTLASFENLVEHTQAPMAIHTIAASDFDNSDPHHRMDESCHKTG
jgi:hypothetical protein